MKWGESVREIEVEKKLVEEVRKRGGLCLKFVSPGYDGVPDRLLLLPKGKIVFVETKAPGKKPRKLQMARHRLFRRLGCRVYVIDKKEQIKEMLDEVEKGGAA